MGADVIVSGTHDYSCPMERICTESIDYGVVTFEFAAELLTFIFKWNNLAPFPSNSMISS